ncbi:hypothetical protein [Paenibacillus xanthanilyticus]|uniref:Uncharacterized protein n=1 Tax=Paenibacillus xanthanilyticus TaxID=1783531 RepID=A0ABV8K7J8_9BACL
MTKESFYFQAQAAGRIIKAFFHAAKFVVLLGKSIYGENHYHLKSLNENDYHY